MESEQLPDHITTALAEIVTDSRLKAHSLKLADGSQAGDGFMSQLISARIKGIRDIDDSEIELNLLCKLPPSNETRRKEFKTDICFERETTFYRKVLPTFTQFQRDRNISESEQFHAYPKCFKTLSSQMGDNDYAIIMEDLRPKGFRMWNKTKPTSINNLHLVLEQLGKFHAISLALKDQKPDLFKEFRKLTDMSKQFLESKNTQVIFNATFERARAALRNNQHKDVMKKIQNRCSDYFNACLGEQVANEFCVITHGDLWNNNILYQFNENDEPIDVRFVDWQLIRYMSPGFDLMYHIFSATDKPLRDGEYMNLLQHYHKSLSQMMKMLGSDTDQLFTFDNLLCEVKKCGNIGFLNTPLLLSISFADSSQTINIDDIYDPTKNEGGPVVDVVGDFTDSGKAGYENRLNDVVIDLLDLGYFNELAEY